jgi:tRNA(Ile)-lysidine synthase
MAARPLSDREFAACMAALGPLGRRPRLAVGVSGGGDSLALTWLLHRWCRRRGGSLLALTVEHGLRPGSAGEARRLGEQLRALGIPRRILPWRGEKPPGAFEAAARAARYALLQAACRRAGLVQLALAHQADDQAETLELRAAAGSGPRGLAGMSAVAALDEVLLLRPLLAVPHARLLATCRAAGLAWSEDPGNADAASSRRAALRARPGRGAARPDRLAAARRAGLRRIRQEGSAALLLARAVAWHPAGFARLSPQPLAAGPEGAVLALGELLRCLGGRDFPPATRALRAALARLSDPAPRGFTLGGCRLLPGAAGWLVAREEAAPPAALAPGAGGRWDRRWAWRLPRAAAPGLALGPLGRSGWQCLSAALAPAPLPGPALWSLPSLSDRAGPLAVPALGWARFPGAGAGLALHFAPNPAGTFGFTVACRQGHII